MWGYITYRAPRTVGRGYRRLTTLTKTVGQSMEAAEKSYPQLGITTQQQRTRAHGNGTLQNSQNCRVRVKVLQTSQNCQVPVRECRVR